MKEYEGKVRVVFKNLVVHPQVTQAHMAGCAAGKQGKFQQWKNDWWEKAFATRQMGPEKIDEIAKGIGGLDFAKFKKDMESAECRALLESDRREMEKFHVQATPGFFVNGQFFGGAFPKDTFKQAIEEKLKIAESSGVPCTDYYDKEIIGKGEKVFRAKKDPKPH